MFKDISIAIPCYNEAPTIVGVIEDFRSVFPDSNIWVFNNNSTDESVSLAKEAGAKVVEVYKQGKGNVMRSIFDHIKSEILIVIDGDGTYLAKDAEQLLSPIKSGRADMVVGNRLERADKESLVVLHQIGNKMIVKGINLAFGTSFQDILSGYRIFNQKFIERIPLLTPKFETETELTLQALEEGLNIIELPIEYKARPKNSHSKLRPFHDGARIMIAAAMLLRDHHPLRIYGFLGAVCLLFSGLAGIVKLTNFYQLTSVSESLLAGIILLFTPTGVIFVGTGFVLSAINTHFRELKQIMFRKGSDL